jgi:hypothetical protein
MLPEPLDEREAIHARHAQIGDHHVRHLRCHLVERVFRGLRGGQPCIDRFEDFADEREGIRLVIDSQDVHAAEIRGNSGRLPRAGSRMNARLFLAHRAMRSTRHS